MQASLRTKLVQRIVLGKTSLKDMLIYAKGKISNARIYTENGKGVDIGKEEIGVFN